MNARQKPNRRESVDRHRNRNGHASSVAPADSTLELSLSAEAGVAELLLWQLGDSAFPTGGFAHSCGLEAAWQHGEVRNRRELLLFLEASLDQVGHAALPFVTSVHGAPERFGELDALCEAFTTNHVANRASKLQGKALLAAAQRIFGVGLPHLASNGAGGESCHASTLHAHYAPVFGAVTRGLNVPHQTATRLFIFNHLRSTLAAAVRLNIVGPMEAQGLLYQLSSRAEHIRQECEALNTDDLAQTSPLIDLWQGTQDRLYSRLFQS